MTEELINQWTIANSSFDDLIQPWMESFIVDRKVQNLAQGTIQFYKAKLVLFLDYCDIMIINHITQITPDIIRQFLAYLKEKGHNPGGIHAVYRTLRTFLNWWESEVEPDNWNNPIRKVKPPKLGQEPLQPVSIDLVDQLIQNCSQKNFLSVRDKAIILFLLDTGTRASELCAINIGDINFNNGSVSIKYGKGHKPRIVFLGQKSRKSLRAYIKLRCPHDEFTAPSPVWVTHHGERLSYWGLNQMLRRRANNIGVKKPELHDFRRAFALSFLRNGGDVFSLQRIMGHADLQVLQRYLAQNTEDLQIAHHKFSPVDNSCL